MVIEESKSTMVIAIVDPICLPPLYSTRYRQRMTASLAQGRSPETLLLKPAPAKIFFRVRQVKTKGSHDRINLPRIS